MFSACLQAGGPACRIYVVFANSQKKLYTHINKQSSDDKNEAKTKHKTPQAKTRQHHRTFQVIILGREQHNKPCNFLGLGNRSRKTCLTFPGTVSYFQKLLESELDFMDTMHSELRKSV